MTVLGILKFQMKNESAKSTASIFPLIAGKARYYGDGSGLGTVSNNWAVVKQSILPLHLEAVLAIQPYCLTENVPL